MARREADTRGMEVGQVSDIAITDGAIRTNNVIEPVGEALNKVYTDALAFNEEKISIMIHESADENAENPVPVGVNGVFRYFPRGQEIVTERKFVDALIVKSGRVSTPEFINGAGERARSIRQHSAHKYPFSVLRDPNPAGAEWLRQRMADAV